MPLSQTVVKLEEAREVLKSSRERRAEGRRAEDAHLQAWRLLSPKERGYIDGLIRGLIESAGRFLPCLLLLAPLAFDP
jgi:hypothetical protein